MARAHLHIVVKLHPLYAEELYDFARAERLKASAALRAGVADPVEAVRLKKLEIALIMLAGAAHKTLRPGAPSRSALLKKNPNPNATPKER